MNELLQELKRRKVFRVSVVYAVVAWVLIEVSATVLPALQMPEWTVSFVTILLILGFPVAIVLAWAYEITPEGIRRDSEVSDAPVSDSGDSQNSPDTIESKATSREPALINEKPCIAVLPFVDMSQEHNQEWFSEGITEEILNGLAKIPQLKVIARTSSFAFKNKDLGISEMGQALNATHILEGSIRSAGNRIRVSTQLGDTKDGAQVWADQYNDELTDVFAVQDKIAAAVSSALNIHLIPALKKAQLHQQVNPEAFRKYLQGRQYLNLVQLDSAIKYFNEAIELDAEFADPHGAAARAHNLYIFFGQASWDDKRELVEQHISQALEIDPEQREALAVRASNMFFIERNYQQAIIEFDRLVRLYTNDTTAVSLYRNVLSALNQPELARRAANRMVDLDPLSPQTINYRGGLHMYQGNYAAAHKDFEEALGLGAKIAQSHANLAFLQRDPDGIDAQLAGIRVQLSEAAYHGFKARSAYLRGETKKVNEALSQIDKNQYVSHLEKAVHASITGDKEGLIREFGYAIESSEFSPFLRIHSASGLSHFDSELVNDPRYQEILIKAGLDADSLSRIKVPELPF